MPHSLWDLTYLERCLYNHSSGTCHRQLGKGDLGIWPRQSSLPAQSQRSGECSGLQCGHMCSKLVLQVPASEHGTRQKGPEDCSAFKWFYGFHVSLQEGIGPAKSLLLIGNLVRELQCYNDYQDHGSRSFIQL